MSLAEKGFSVLIGGMWKGRFEQQTTSNVIAYTESISFDWRLYKHDIQGSIAHANGLVRAGILSKKEFEAIQKGLLEIGDEIEEGRFIFKTELEDIHMNIEKALTDRIGEAGAKLHTARSRNDQVATDLRLYCRAESEAILKGVENFQRVLVEKARAYANAPIPGYTHLQRGQPVTFGHHLLAYVEMLDRDAGRLKDGLKRINVLPLGSGALAGSTIALDREAVAKELGFDAVSQNSMDAVSDRDFVAELLFNLSLLGIHLSRLSEDIVLWCSSEFSFVTLSDAHTTGSSLMPQKKNPDIAEITRGKTGRLVGGLMSLLTMLKGLPMTYNRDLQEDKEPLFDSIDTIKKGLEVNAEMLSELTLNKGNAEQAASDPLLLATDLADYLVQKEVPFRNAHEVIGKIVQYCLKENKSLTQLSLKELEKFSPAFQEDAKQKLTLHGALESRDNLGAPAPRQVEAQLKGWEKRLKK